MLWLLYLAQILMLMRRSSSFAIIKEASRWSKRNRGLRGSSAFSPCSCWSSCRRRFSVVASPVQQRQGASHHHRRRAFRSVDLKRAALPRRHASRDPADETNDISSLLVEEVAKNLQKIHRVATEAAASRQRHNGLENDDDEEELALRHKSVAPSLQPQPPCTAIYLLGVSGGSDSVALFHLMVRHIRSLRGRNVDVDSLREGEQQPPPPVLHVVHFDHRQRGSASDGDCEFVQNLCRDHRVPCHVYSWDDENEMNVSARLKPSMRPPSHHPPPPFFSQDAARNWRRRTMKQLLSNLLLRDHHSQQQKAQDDPNRGPGGEAVLPTHEVGILLTAHHLNDSHESLLLKLLRGTHLTNLQGMSPFQVDSCDFEGDRDFEDGIRLDTMVWGRPLLSIPKSKLVRFLEANGYQWRDDDSNTSKKYLRNRVRNELVPLLKDLVGGSDATLQRRLEHISQQSREMHEYFHRQGQEHLLRHSLSPSSESSSPLFDPVSDVFQLLPTTQKEEPQPDLESSLDLIAQHALHQWLVEQTRGRSRSKSSASAASVPYEQVRRICAQLKDHPRNRSWKLDIGENWTVVRQGDVLRVEELSSSAINEESSCPGLAKTVELNWSSATRGSSQDASSTDESRETSLVLHLPSELVALGKFRLLSAPASAVEQSSSLFQPPWRASCVSLKDFLRGQKVPLHQRPRTPLILLQETSQGEQPTLPSQVVAVQVAFRQSEWTVDARYLSGTVGTSPIRVSAQSLESSVLVGI